MTSGEITKALGPQGVGQQSIANALSTLTQTKKISSEGRGGKYRSVAPEVPTAPDQPSS
jgi:putative ribosome biogenesis GTPase RsgA